LSNISLLFFLSVLLAALGFNKLLNFLIVLFYLLLFSCHGTPPQGASIEEPRALAYTSRIAYISYARVYHLLTPSTLTIDRVTSYRLLKYIHSAATILHLITLHCAFFLPPTPSLQLILYLYNTVGTARSSISISNLHTIIVRRYSLLATMLSLKSNPIP
jgi:hypothetical protein